MQGIWNERRFLFSGIVFLTVSSLMLLLSGGFEGLGETDAKAFAAIAAVVAAGISGYPLGLILYAPFDLIFRFWGYYGLYYKNKENCSKFADILEDAAQRPNSPARALRGFAEAAAKDRTQATQFITSFYRRFAAEAVKRPARTRWERFNTAGGFLVAIVAGIGLSPLVVLAVDGADPWWDDSFLLRAVSYVALFILLILVGHMHVIALEAVRIDMVWLDDWFDAVERRPEILEMAGLDPSLDQWVLKQTGETSRRPRPHAPARPSPLGFIAFLFLTVGALLVRRKNASNRL